MDWYREPGNRMQARFALNAALLLDDYESLTRGRRGEKYEVTLTVCVLQALLTNCTELLRVMNDHGKGDFAKRIDEEEGPLWGIEPSFITTNLPETPTLYRVLVNMRNALSHPLMLESVDVPCSGFWSISDGSPNITAIRFTSSPWADNGRRASFVTSDTSAGAKKALNKQTEKLKLGEGFLEVVERPDGTFDLGKTGERGREFWPCFSIEMPLAVMVDLAGKLSLWLAQPVDGHPVGKSARPLKELAPS